MKTSSDEDIALRPTSAADTRARFVPAVPLVQAPRFVTQNHGAVRHVCASRDESLRDVQHHFTSYRSAKRRLASSLPAKATPEATARPSAWRALFLSPSFTYVIPR